MDTTILTVPEAAAQLRVSRGMIYLLVARHELRAIRIGKRVLFEPEFLISYLETAKTSVSV